MSRCPSVLVKSTAGNGRFSRSLTSERTTGRLTDANVLVSMLFSLSENSRYPSEKSLCTSCAMRRVESSLLAISVTIW